MPLPSTIPVPMTKATWIALLILLALIFSGRWFWAVAFAVGWSLGGDGAVFKSVWAMVAARNSEKVQ